MNNIERHIKEILKLIGEDPTREGLLQTPARVEKAYKEWFRGYNNPPFKTAIFKSDYTGIVLRKDVPFQSFCEHHMAIYKGTIDFAYIPNGYVIGLSKIPRVLQHYSARLTIQEELTENLMDRFYNLFAYRPKGAMIIVKAWHSCESSRGIKVNALTTTSAVRGIFSRDPSAKSEVLQLLR